MTQYDRALERERNREWYRRKTEQGAFESSFVRLDRLVGADDDGEKLSLLSDNGGGAGKIISQSEADAAYAEQATLHYWQRYRAAYMRLKRCRPFLCRTFSLICKYGANRNASIAELQSETKDWDAAHRLYFSRREKILDFFRAQ